MNFELGTSCKLAPAGVPAGGIDEHNCLGQLKDKGIKIDCN